jgi:hypothetical protein
MAHAPSRSFNRVVHSSHFWAIFGSFSISFFISFFKNGLQNGTEKWSFLKNRTLPSLVQKCSLSLSFSRFIFVIISNSTATPVIINITTPLPHLYHRPRRVHDATIPSLPRPSTTTTTPSPPTTPTPARAASGRKQPFADVT